MTRINLKNILSAKTPAFALVYSLIRQLNAAVWVEDHSQKTLVGEALASPSHREPVTQDEEIIGWVAGDDKTPLIASLINVLVQKESEKRKLGQEVLTLYQEVNLMFNFSDQLAQTIGQSQIAAITLDEARRLIRSSQGMIVLWNEEINQLDVLAASGELLFEKENLTPHTGLFLDIARSGLSEIMGDLSPLVDSGLIKPTVKSLIYAALKVKHRVLGAIVLASDEVIQYSAADLKFLITLALQSSSAIESALLYEKSIREAKEREEAMRRVYEVTNKFVPHEFIRSLGKEVITDIQLGDKVEKMVTVLFSDIREYTTLSEQMTPDENFSFVCSFNERMGPIIRENHGFINQYLGDAIMAIFPGNASDALQAAISMQQAVQELNVGRVAQSQVPIKVGVGMHTGPLIMGITGDHERLDAATISDTVNTASRLESLTKHYKVNILLSEASVNNLADSSGFHYRQLGLIQLKGRLAPVYIYECFNGNEEDDLNKKLSALPIYSQGMFNYFGRDFREASANFSQVLKIHPEDITSKLFLDKANRYISHGIPEGWTGVDEMGSK